MRREDPPRGWPDGFGASASERRALIRLSHVTWVAPRRIHALAWEAGNAAVLLERVLAGALGETAVDVAGAARADDVEARLRSASARLVTPADPEYPRALLDLLDPPAWLFVRGRRLEVPWPAVAIVGSRSASAYGREVADVLGRGLGAAGVPVISGAALGIDGAAHAGALAVRGPTVAVLGSGVDRPYPTAHGELIDAIAAEGAVVSEYPPGVKARPQHFPARNRIVVALASAVVVVEGAAGSGSLISAEFAQQLGREILAVPGSIASTLSEVPHGLIRDGATLIRGPADVLEAVHRFDRYADAASLSTLGPEERTILEGLGGAAATAEAVAAATGIPLGRAIAALSALELGGLVRERGGRYERTLLAARS